MNQPRTRDTDPGAIAGRERLLDAAERLFDERGVDACSARAIAMAAGHRNTAAVWYHFGDRAGLVKTLADRWALALEARRSALLDALDARPDSTPRDYARASLQPWVEILDTSEGRRRVRLIAQMTHHPVYSQFNQLGFAPSTARGVAQAMPFAAHLSVERRVQRAQTVVLCVTSMLAMQATLLDEDPPRRPPLPPEEFLDEMTNVIIAVVSAP